MYTYAYNVNIGIQEYPRCNRNESLHYTYNPQVSAILTVGI